MKNWAEFGFGLVIADGEPALDVLMDRVIEEHAPAGAEDPGIFDVCEYLKETPAGRPAWYDEDNEGKVFYPAVNGCGESLEGESMLAFMADQQPDPFSAVYTMESVVEEFRRKLGKYLPEDFDYLAHIGEYRCVNWG